MMRALLVDTTIVTGPVGDDNCHPHIADFVQLFGKFQWHADAAVAGGIAGQVAGVHGDPVPRQALHIGHGRAVIQVGLMVLVLLQDGEDSSRGLFARLARRHGAHTDADAIAIDERQLRLEIDDHHDRAFGGDPLSGFQF